MKKFKSIKAIKRFKQLNNATPGKVFPLLGPVREKEWLDIWKQGKC